jgi:DNA-directed RNA polymerase subunit F
MTEKNAAKKKLTIPQVKKVLEAMGEENLDQFQRRTLDYAAKFSKTEAEAAEGLMERLVTEFGLDEDEAVQVLNCMPNNVEELRVFLAGGRKIIEASKLQTIVNLLNEQRK